MRVLHEEQTVEGRSGLPLHPQRAGGVGDGTERGLSGGHGGEFESVGLHLRGEVPRSQPQKCRCFPGVHWLLYEEGTFWNRDNTKLSDLSDTSTVAFEYPISRQTERTARAVLQTSMIVHIIIICSKYELQNLGMPFDYKT